MDLQHVLAASNTVEVINVLCDHVLQNTLLFHLNHGIVPRIGLGLVHGHFQLVGRVSGTVFVAKAGFPPLLRVTHKLLVRKIGWLAVLGPEPARPAKWRNSTLNRQSRAR